MQWPETSIATRNVSGWLTASGKLNKEILPLQYALVELLDLRSSELLGRTYTNAAGYYDNPSGQQFQDVPVGSTYYTYTYRLVSRSIMSGYPCGADGEPCNPPDNLPYFRPNKNATRGQTSKIVANTFFPDCQTPSR